MHTRNSNVDTAKQQFTYEINLMQNLTDNQPIHVPMQLHR
jgi:hypothetical protein